MIHSWYNPTIKIIKNNIDVNIHGKVIVLFNVKTIGRIIIISISKIKNNTAIRKKWIENGSRLYLIGLNPHSNGVDFCISIIVFFPIIIIRIRIAEDKIMITNKYNIINLIIYFLGTFKLEA